MCDGLKMTGKHIFILFYDSERQRDVHAAELPLFFIRSITYTNGLVLQIYDGVKQVAIIT